MYVTAFTDLNLLVPYWAKPALNVETVVLVVVFCSELDRLPWVRCDHIVALVLWIDVDCKDASLGYVLVEAQVHKPLPLPDSGEHREGLGESLQVVCLFT